MSDELPGFIVLHRKVKSDWKWATPLFRSAWLSILMAAAWSDEKGCCRSQLILSIRDAANEWGMSKSAAHDFVKRCVDEGSLAVEIVDRRFYDSERTLKRTADRTPERTVTRTHNPYAAMLITVLNYERYQSIKVAKEGSPKTVERTLKRTADRTPERTFLRNNKKQVLSSNEESTGNANTFPPPPEKRPLLKKPEKIIEAIEAIDMGPLEERWSQAIVNEVLPEFRKKCVEGTPQKPVPNPYNYRDWPKALNGWCEKRVRDGPRGNQKTGSRATGGMDTYDFVMDAIKGKEI